MERKLNLSKQMNYTTKLFVSLAALLIAYSAPADACRCGKPNVDTAMKSAEAIALVKITQAPVVGKPPLPRAVTYKGNIERVLKGDGEVGTVHDIVTAGSSAACGRTFKVGQTYILFAGSMNGKYYDNACSASAELDAAGKHPHLSAVETWTASGKTLPMPEKAKQGSSHGKPVSSKLPTAQPTSATSQPATKTPSPIPAASEGAATQPATVKPPSKATVPAEAAETTTPRDTKGNDPEPARESCSGTPPKTLALMALLGIFLRRRRTR